MNNWKLKRDQKIKNLKIQTVEEEKNKINQMRLGMNSKSR
jgi:hypothetical protein